MPLEAPLDNTAGTATADAGASETLVGSSVGVQAAMLQARAASGRARKHICRDIHDIICVIRRSVPIQLEGGPVTAQVRGRRSAGPMQRLIRDADAESQADVCLPSLVVVFEPAGWRLRLGSLAGAMEWSPDKRHLVISARAVSTCDVDHICQDLQTSIGTKAEAPGLGPGASVVLDRITISE